MFNQCSRCIFLLSLLYCNSLVECWYKNTPLHHSPYINRITSQHIRNRQDSHNSHQTMLLDTRQEIDYKVKTKQESPSPSIEKKGVEFPPNFSSSSATISVKEDNETQEANNRSAWIARGMLLTVAAFYGTNFGCVKILGAALHPGIAAVFRFSLASLVFLPQLIKVIKTNKEIVVAGLEIGIYNSIGYFAQAESLLSTRASNVAFICSLAVIVVPIIESLFGEQKGWPYLKSALFPAMLAAAGVGCLELGGSVTPGIGDLWAFLQPLFFGLAFWRIERHIKKCTQPGDAQAFTGACMLVTAVLSVVWSIHDFVLPIAAYGDPAMFKAAMESQFTNVLNDWHVPVAIAWTGIVTTALTSYVENVAMKELDAAESTVIYSTEPLWGAAFASVTLGEQIGWNTIFGAMLILCACAWRTIGAQVVGMLSSSSLLEKDGWEEIVENMNVNVMKLFQSGFNSGDIPSEL